ncbi:MAG: hypothetical protein LBM73_02630, partial [Candidatus Nomurabacteria bacterium]|nr:hypothetical protein [Candidatus Nomurabacteria bacterium]
MNQDFWQRQTAGRALWPDVVWSKPERRDAAGKLLVVGGSKNGFTAVSGAFSLASKLGVGAVKVALPDALKKTLPPNLLDAIFLPSNPSGGLARGGLDDLIAAGNWADQILLVGDSGQNSETAILFEEFLRGCERPAVITRDAADLLRPAANWLLSRPKTHLTLSFAQTQKLFREVLYPKMLTFSLNLSAVVDNLHKFTITYPISLTIFHQNNLIAAAGGQVVSQKFYNPNRILDGKLATPVAAWQILAADL